MASLDSLVCTGQCSALGPHLQLLLSLHHRAQPEVTQIGIESASYAVRIAFAVITPEVAPF